MQERPITWAQRLIMRRLKLGKTGKKMYSVWKKETCSRECQIANASTLEIQALKYYSHGNSLKHFVISALFTIINICQRTIAFPIGLFKMHPEHNRILLKVIMFKSSFNIAELVFSYYMKRSSEENLWECLEGEMEGGCGVIIS